MSTKYFCLECRCPIPNPPKEWRGHLVMECPSSRIDNIDNPHGAVDYGLMGSPWIRYWNVEARSDGKAE